MKPTQEHDFSIFWLLSFETQPNPDLFSPIPQLFSMENVLAVCRSYTYTYNYLGHWITLKYFQIFLPFFTWNEIKTLTHHHLQLFSAQHSVLRCSHLSISCLLLSSDPVGWAWIGCCCMKLHTYIQRYIPQRSQICVKSTWSYLIQLALAF